MEGQQRVAAVCWGQVEWSLHPLSLPQASAMTSVARWPSYVRSTYGVSTCAVQHLSSSSLIRPTTSSTSHARWAGLQPHLLARPPGPSPAPSPPTPRYGTRYTCGSCVCDPLPKTT